MPGICILYCLMKEKKESLIKESLEPEADAWL